MWKICIAEPFMNCEKIYPIQQKKVKRLIDILSNNSNVKKIIIFGSSVSDRCHIDSDIDIFIELEKEERRLIKRYIDFRFDLWTNFDVDDRLLNEIMKDGVLVWQEPC